MAFGEIDKTYRNSEEQQKMQGHRRHLDLILLISNEELHIKASNVIVSISCIQ